MDEAEATAYDALRCEDDYRRRRRRGGGAGGMGGRRKRGGSVKRLDSDEGGSASCGAGDVDLPHA